MEVRSMSVARHHSFEDRLVDVQALAVLLNRSPQAIYDLRHRGLLPAALRIGSRIAWLSEDIETWLQNSKEVVDA
jgi:predicted DNA-binding transcriptional regulator AlpA